MFQMIHLHEDPAAAAAATADDPAAAAAQAAAAAPAAAAPAGGESLIADPAAPAGDDWLPEKFRVTGEDGKVDEAASARKLAESYRQLEAHKGPLPQAPAQPEDYKLEAPKDAEGKPIEGLDFDAFTKDPLFQSFQKAAHAKGMTNEQLQFVTERYIELAPQLFAADKSLSADEARAELGKLWPDQAAMAQNLQTVRRAIAGFGGKSGDMPGSASRLMEKYGTDPDFIAFAAAVGAEMSEDRVPIEGVPGSEVEAEALQKSEAYWKPEHPDHAATKAKVAAFYARKYGNAPHR